MISYMMHLAVLLPSQDLPVKKGYHLPNKIWSLWYLHTILNGIMSQKTLITSSCRGTYWLSHMPWWWCHEGFEIIFFWIQSRIQKTWNKLSYNIWLETETMERYQHKSIRTCYTRHIQNINNRKITMNIPQYILKCLCFCFHLFNTTLSTA